MNCRLPALAPLLPLLVGCHVSIDLDDAGSSDDDVGSDGGSSSDGTSSDGTTTDGTTTDGTGTFSTDGSDTVTGSDGDTGIEFCGLSEGPDTPWFEIYEEDQAIVPGGGDLKLVCGGQGFFMFDVAPALGGFVPEAETVAFNVVIDVDGFNLGPDGHFAVWSGAIFVGCCEPMDYDCAYYSTTSMFIFPPDAIPDKTVLHQQPGVMTVTMDANGEPIEQVVDIQLWAMDDGSWEFCMFYDQGGEEPLPIAAPIPLPAMHTPPG